MGYNGDLYPTAGADVVMTTAGDLVKFTTERARLGIGSESDVLTVSSGAPVWSAPVAGGVSLSHQADQERARRLRHLRGRGGQEGDDPVLLRLRPRFRTGVAAHGPCQSGAR